MPEMTYVDSSNIDQVGYDRDAMELHVQFKDGGLYVYDGVPEHLFDGLLASASKGSFLNREVKNTYSFRKA